MGEIGIGLECVDDCVVEFVDVFVNGFVCCGYVVVFQCVEYGEVFVVDVLQVLWF